MFINGATDENALRPTLLLGAVARMPTGSKRNWSPLAYERLLQVAATGVRSHFGRGFRLAQPVQGRNFSLLH